MGLLDTVLREDPETQGIKMPKGLRAKLRWVVGRDLVEALTYRLMASVLTFTVSTLITGSIEAGLTIAIFADTGKVAAYWLNKKLWQEAVRRRSVEAPTAEGPVLDQAGEQPVEEQDEAHPA